MILNRFLLISLISISGLSYAAGFRTLRVRNKKMKGPQALLQGRIGGRGAFYNAGRSSSKEWVPGQRQICYCAVGLVLAASVVTTLIALRSNVVSKS